MTAPARHGSGGQAAREPGATGTGPHVAGAPGSAAGVPGPVQFGPQVPPLPLFGRRWTGPAGPASRTVLGASAAAGVLAAVAVPEGPPGLGWLVLVAGWAALAVLVRQGARPGPTTAPGLRVRGGWGALAVGFAAVPALRDAPWLTVLCLLAAVPCASIAVAGPAFRSLPGAFVLWPAALRALPWAGRSAGHVGQRGARTVMSALVGVALLVVFLPLLASADPGFADLVDALIPQVDGSGAVRAAVLAAAGATLMLGAAFLLVGPPAPAVPTVSRPSWLRPLEWMLPLAALAALFGLFVAVQVATLLAGDAHVRAATTYAEYARGGFWQLLVVSVLALGVILAGRRLAPPGHGRVVLAVLDVLTLGIVVTALGRMWLYQQAYGFTVLRLLVLACELWLGAAFVLLLVAVLRRRLPRGIVATGAAMLLALALLDPEGFVAARDVDRFAATGRLDDSYLATLSADAVPALAGLPEPQRSCVLAGMTVRPDLDWRSLNAARTEASPLVATASPCLRPPSARPDR